PLAAIRLRVHLREEHAVIAFAHRLEPVAWHVLVLRRGGVLRESARRFGHSYHPILRCLDYPAALLIPGRRACVGDRRINYPLVRVRGQLRREALSGSVRGIARLALPVRK